MQPTLALRNAFACKVLTTRIHAEGFAAGRRDDSIHAKVRVSRQPAVVED
jgi:hypothetical protein